MSTWLPLENKKLLQVSLQGIAASWTGNSSKLAIHIKHIPPFVCIFKLLWVRHNLLSVGLSRCLFIVLNKQDSQSCAVAKSEKFWWATAQSNLTYERLAATKASNVWFSYSHKCTFASGAVFHSVCQVWLFRGPPELFTFCYCTWLWNWIIALKPDKTRAQHWIAWLVIKPYPSPFPVLVTYS